MLCLLIYMCRYPSYPYGASAGLISSLLLLAFRRFAARRGPVSVMYSDNAQTFRCVDSHLNILQSDPNIQDLLAKRKLLWIYSASLLRRTNGRACLFYDELEVNLIEIESVINARPLR